VYGAQGNIKILPLLCSFHLLSPWRLPHWCQKWDMERMEEERRMTGDAMRECERPAGHSAPTGECSLVEASCHPVAGGTATCERPCWGLGDGA